MRKAFTFTALVCGMSATLAWSSVPKWNARVDASQGEVEFVAIGRPSALKIRGKTGAPKGEVRIENGKASGAFVLSLTALDTGINLRNQHMKEKYLEVGKFPEAKLLIESVDLPSDISAGEGSRDGLPFLGVLTLHGVQKPVAGSAKVERRQSSVEVEAQFGIKLSDFGVTTPSYAGITVAEDVQVKVRFATPITMQK